MPPAKSTKPRKLASPAATQPAATQPHLPVLHRLHTLLHTMRSIEQHEEHLCTLLHHIETTHQLTPAITRELRTLVDTLPALAYQADLDAIHQALTPPSPTPRRPAKPVSKPK